MSHTQYVRPQTFKACELIIRIILDAITHSAKTYGRIPRRKMEPRPKETQTPKTMVTIPLANAQPERSSFLSPKNEITSEVPEISAEIPMNIIRETKFCSGLNSMDIPKIVISMPETSISHFAYFTNDLKKITLSIFLIIVRIIFDFH